MFSSYPTSPNDQAFIDRYQILKIRYNCHTLNSCWTVVIVHQQHEQDYFYMQCILMQCCIQMYFGTIWKVWAPKKGAQISSFNTFSIYISCRNWMKYSLQILKNKNIFKRHKYPFPNVWDIKYFWTLSYNHWGSWGITELSNP